MPNWCSTDLTFNGEEKELKKLADFVEEYKKKKLPGVSFDWWLGNILIYSGVGTFDEVVKGDIDCRGCITYTELTEDQYIVQTETAWGPMVRLWKVAIEALGLDLEIIYTAIEPGCEIYVTNDPVYYDAYIVDGSDLDNGDYWDVLEDEAKELLDDFVKRHPEAEVRGWYADDGDDYISIHKWEFVEVEESR